MKRDPAAVVSLNDPPRADRGSLHRDSQHVDGVHVDAYGGAAAAVLPHPLSPVLGGEGQGEGVQVALTAC